MEFRGFLISLALVYGRANAAVTARMGGSGFTRAPDRADAAASFWYKRRRRRGRSLD
jgi:hypothetical protein